MLTIAKFLGLYLLVNMFAKSMFYDQLVVGYILPIHKKAVVAWHGDVHNLVLKWGGVWIDQQVGKFLDGDDVLYWEIIILAMAVFWLIGIFHRGVTK